MKFFRPALGAIALALSVMVGAQMTAPTRNPDGTINKTHGLGVNQKIGNQLPLDDVFINSHGQKVTLGQYFGKRPVVINLIYFNCKSACLMELNGLVTSFSKMSLSPTLPLKIGRDVTVLSISIDPQETTEMASQKKMEIVPQLTYNATDGWHFLTGSMASIQKLVTALGYQYTYDPKENLINHPVAIAIATPKGIVSQYLFGDDYPERRLGQAIQVAGYDETGQKEQEIFFGCLARDPKTGRYTLVIDRFTEVVGCTWVAVMAIGVVYWGRKYPTKPTFGGGTAA